LYEGIYPSLAKYVKDYDIIQVGGYVGLTSCWLNIFAKDKTVNYNGLYYCEDNVGDIKKAKMFDRTLLRLQNRKNMVVATKSVLATDYLKEKGIENVTTIGVGLDLDNLLSSVDKLPNNDFADTIRNSKFDKKLLYIGVLEERRNILFLLDVFKKVSEQVPGLGLVLIGKGKSEYVSMCMKKIEELGLQDQVIYRESLEQKYMPEIYQACDAFLLPTRYEIFGMVLLEAMYYGLPVFTTYNGGSATLMDTENGIVIDSVDVQEWSEKIVDILSDEKRCQEIGDNAHKTVAENYTWDALADKFLDVYEKRLRRVNEGE
jgi:glycosyltransferase involved in cell wall biosynthesis